MPRLFGRVHSGRQTPFVAILFTTALGFGLVATSKVEDLGDTTALLLLCVFAVVNVAVLVLRQDTVDHDHFRAPTVLPVLGALTCGVLASPFVGREGSVYLTAAVLLGIGVLLWFANRAVVGPSPDVDEEKLSGVP